MSVLESSASSATGQIFSARSERSRRSRAVVNYRDIEEYDGLEELILSQQDDEDKFAGNDIDGEINFSKRKGGNVKRKKRNPESGYSVKKKKPSESPEVLYGPLPIQRTTQSWIQQAPCQRLRQLPQCQSCITRKPFLGSCRFSHFRIFDHENNQPINVDKYAFASLEDTLEILFDPSFTTNPSKETRIYALRTITPFFHDILIQENEHEQQPHLIRRPREKGVRPLCDTCATTIFSGFWFCYVCGREFCLDCYNEWDEGSNSDEHIQRCSRRRKHRKKHLIPLTRSKVNEISDLLARVCKIETISLPVVVSQKLTNTQQLHEWTAPVVHASVDTVSEDDFQAFWSKGIPFLLHDVGKDFKLAWDANYFLENYGMSACHLVDCENGDSIPATVQEFFEHFTEGIFRGEPRNLKLKDWPPTEDFSKTFPDLFEDFEQALPFPSYTRRYGYLNLNSRFPPDYLPPDLGPKMYIAYPSFDSVGGKGTTNLHLDMTDAINIMVHAVENPEKRGCAVWDIFSARDTDKIRCYLLDKLPVKDCDDPIHRQRYYLTTDQLKELNSKHGVQSYRLYQNQGDAVFIPAGCAHQVCNLSSCIKVACDFVSPENVSRCGILTEETRRLAKNGKREDVLQLKNILYFAWKQMDREDKCK